MTARRPSFANVARPSGPRCRGGVSSMLRLGQRAASMSARAFALPRDNGFGEGAIEHVLGVPAAWLNTGR